MGAVVRQPGPRRGEGACQGAEQGEEGESTMEEQEEEIYKHSVEGGGGPVCPHYTVILEHTIRLFCISLL